MDFESDYIVEEYIKPTKVRVPLINDERADILGNFEDDDDKSSKKKRKREKVKNFDPEENPFEEEDEAEEGSAAQDNDSAEEDRDDEEIESEIEENNENVEDEAMITVEEENKSEDEAVENVEEEKSISTSKAVKSKKKKSKQNSNPENEETATKSTDKLTDDQLKSLMKGVNKKDRFVLYVTNLSYESSKNSLEQFFSVAGQVKTVRVPKTRKTAYAFVEMADIQSFRNALELHNKSLDGWKIKVQVSEGGKKKSANKKNILKQKNRKLAEMRNEGKQFSRSGKGYNKTLKKEIAQDQKMREIRMARKNKKKTANKN